ncbi:type II toxin-antitoxin system VapC family toxin [Lacipirellula limnantheis]|uniref:type II toxin-antitoxin system VapC family toxin n=1 Tax=Lacipirellula limnantheis TaxID=2528024 RepID=UPI0011A2112A|nr:PIN domain-containing protein [Lacipirellula limnantheis]
MTSLRTAGHSLALVPQVFYELWSVLTRPAANNGLGFSIEQSLEDQRRILDSSELFEDDSGVFAAWRDLDAKYRVLGKQAHDARLVAAMVRHGIGHLMTFNDQDFARFIEIAVIAPPAAAAFPPAGGQS